MIRLIPAIKAIQPTYTEFIITNTHTHTHYEASEWLNAGPVYCCVSHARMMHVSAAVVHYQISLACLCNVGSANVSECDPGSERTSEPRLLPDSPEWLCVGVHVDMYVDAVEAGGGMCAFVCRFDIMSGSECSIFGWQ